MTNTDSIEIVLKSEGPGAPVAIRLRSFLKNALRQYGLRCINIVEVPSLSNTGRQAAQDAIERDDQQSKPSIPSNAPRYSQGGHTQ